LRLELGNHQYPMLAGLVASVEHLAALCHFDPAHSHQSAGGAARRERLLASMAALASYQEGLHANLADSLRASPEVMVLVEFRR